MPKIINWACPELQPTQMNVDLIQGEFFTDPLVGHNLVREALQNAMDELRPDNAGPVEVRFALRTGDRALPAARAQRYLNGLKRRLEICDGVRDDQVEMAGGDRAMPFLVVEDFQTKGLCGDVSQIADVNLGAGERNNFYWFFRNSARSGKRSEDAGSWGVGKTVFQESSSINSNYVLTMRYDDARRLLMGQTLLKSHQEVDGTQVRRYAAYGYWAEQNSPRDPYMPIEDVEFIDEFAADFQLTRIKESGLSIVVPFPDPSITAGSLIRGVIVSYFRPIVAGKLVVIVDDNGVERKLDSADSLRELVDQIELDGPTHNAEELKQLFELTENLETLPPKDTVVLKDARITADVIRADVIDDMRRRFDDGKLLSVRVPQQVTKRDGVRQDDEFRIAITSDGGGRNRRPYYVRDQLSLSDNGPLTIQPTSALVVVERGPLAELLRASENPSHSAWNSSKRDRFREWVAGGNAVSAVNNSVNNLLHLLLGERGKRRPDALIDFFFDDLPRDSRTKRRRKNRPGPPRPPRPPRFYRYEPIAGDGFRIFGTGEGSLQPIRVRVAYDREDELALQRYSPLDFDLTKGDIAITWNGASVKTESENELLIAPDREDFEVQLVGFGGSRDLFVQTRAEG